MATKPKAKTKAKSAGRKATSTMRAAEARRERFVAEYLLTFNITQSAIAAGFSPRSAHAQGSTLLKDPRVKAMVNKAQAKSIEQLTVSRETVIAELAKLAFSNGLDYGSVDNEGQFAVDLSQTTRGQFAAVQEIRSTSKRYGKDDDATVERSTVIKLAGKREALVDLGRYLGIFKDEGAAAMNVSFTITGLQLEEKKTA